jgi:hypothetical protein
MPTAAPPGIAVVPLSADQALALDARYLMGLLADPSRRPRRWAAPVFAREVELVRAHLRPIRTRAALAASFGREAFHGRFEAPMGGGGLSAVRVAYATRWLELGEPPG